MRKTFNLLFILLTGLLITSCGGDDSAEQTDAEKAAPTSMIQKAEDTASADSKGVGPISSVSLDAEVNQELAANGEEIFKAKCTACHRLDKKFIGPSPVGVMDRRSPEWIMNMILNPDGMVKEDATARQLLIEFNGAPMANQNLTEDDARAVLEYFRTI